MHDWGAQYTGTQRRFPPKYIENTFKAIQSTFRSVEIHSLPNYKGLSIIFPKILDEIWCITKVRHFLIPLAISFMNPKILDVLFLRKIT